MHLYFRKVEGMRTRQMLRLARATLCFLLIGVDSTTEASFQKRSVGKYGRKFSNMGKNEPAGKSKIRSFNRLTAKHFGDLWG